MILLSVSFAVTASTSLSLSEGDSSRVTLYAPDGTILDSEEVGESGTVIKTDEDAVAFTSDYGDIYLSENSMLAVTSYDLSDSSLYLVYGGISAVLKENLTLRIFTPSSYVTLTSPGEYVLVSTDSEESFHNFSEATVTAYDGIRGLSTEVGPMEALDYKAWPRESTEVSDDEYIAYSAIAAGKPLSPTVEDPSVAVPPSEPVVVDVEWEPSVPSSPTIAEPGVSVTPPAPVVIDIPQRETAAVTEPAAETEEETVETVPDADETAPVAEETATAVEETVPAEEVAVPDAAVTERTEETAAVTPAPMKEEKKSIFSGGLEVGYDYIFNSAVSIFEVTPRLRIGNDDFAIALRAPIRLALNGNDFYLAGFNGYKELDFGASEESEEMKIYRAVTDSLAFIDSLTLGNEEYSLAYINADRSYRKNSTLFMDYGKDDDLAVRAGFNFPNLALSIYADNAQAPHIMEGALTFYPVRFGGASLSFIVPSEILMQSSFKDYTLMLYPEIKLRIPFTDKFALSAYAIGEIRSVYENGTMVNSDIIYDFADSRMCSYMAGASFDISFDAFKLGIDGGIRSGSLTPDRFSAVSAATHRTLYEETAESEMTVFARADLSIGFGPFEVAAAYAVTDLLAFSDDYFSLSIYSELTDHIKLYGRFAKDNFSDFDSEDYFMTDALFAIGADFTVGNAGFSAELKSVFDSTASTYINVPDYLAAADLGISVKARLFF